MIVVEIRFPAGRYHATAWGSHANEGVIEWPPSPWRVLRALIAVWYRKRQDLAEATVRSLIEALASAPPPSFRLPAGASLAHTRHYMPIGKLDNGVEKTTKIIDAFAHTDGALAIGWDAELGAEEGTALSELWASMNYFGRAESLIEAAVVEDDDSFEADARPLLEGEDVGSKEETVRLMAPVPPLDYAAWRKARQSAEGKGRKAKRFEPAPTLFGALCADTDDWRGSGWSQPPGSRWLVYCRPQGTTRPAVTERLEYPGDRHFTAARFELSGAVLPNFSSALSFTEYVHQKLVMFSSGAQVFTGRDDQRQPLKGHHHAYILPELDERGHGIRYVTVVTQGPDALAFTGKARQALDRVQKEGRKIGGKHELHLTLVGIWETGDLEELIGTGKIDTTAPLLGESDRWTSLTPFVPTRHRKKATDADGLAVGSPEHDLRRLLADVGFPAPVAVEPVDALEASNGRRWHWARFQRDRFRGAGIRAGHRGYGFHLTFSEPVRGPIAVGYGAHFGLGLFIPARD